MVREGGGEGGGGGEESFSTLQIWRTVSQEEQDKLHTKSKKPLWGEGGGGGARRGEKR